MGLILILEIESESNRSRMIVESERKPLQVEYCQKLKMSHPDWELDQKVKVDQPRSELFRNWK